MIYMHVAANLVSSGATLFLVGIKYKLSHSFFISKKISLAITLLLGFMYSIINSKSN